MYTAEVNIEEKDKQRDRYIYMYIHGYTISTVYYSEI